MTHTIKDEKVWPHPVQIRVKKDFFDIVDMNDEETSFLSVLAEGNTDNPTEILKAISKFKDGMVSLYNEVVLILETSK